MSLVARNVTKFAGHLVFTHLVLLLQSTLIVAEVCKIPANYHMDHKLHGYVIMTFRQVPTKEDCSEACSFNSNCHSVNFYKSNKTCELNDANNDSASPGSMHKVIGSDYINYDHRPPTKCADKAALGMEDGRISDSQLTARGFYSPMFTAVHARLNGPSGWSPRIQNTNQWIQVKFDKPRNISGIATQGLGSKSQWVKTFTVKYGNDEDNLVSYNNGQVFVGNKDSGTAVRNKLNLTAKFVRICPLTWNENIAMRFELYNCNL